MDCSTPGFPVLHCLPQFAQTHVDWVDDAIQSSHPLSFPSYPAFNLSKHQGLFQWVVLCIRWPKYWCFSFSINSVQSLSHVWLFSSPLDCSMSGFPVYHQLLELSQTPSVIPSQSSSIFLPSIFPSIRVFSTESVLQIKWPKYWSFSFSISLSNEYSGLISFRIDWLELLAVQGTLKSLLQHHISRASILCHSAFFMVQISHPYMTTGKTIALTRWTLLAKSYLCFLIGCLGWS